MTKSEAQTLTVKQYAVLANVSLSTAYRKMHARKVWGLAAKVNGRYVVKLSVEEVRTWKAALVERDAYASRQIALAWQVKDGTIPGDGILSLDAGRVLRNGARDSLVALGAGDIIHAVDSLRIKPTDHDRGYLAKLIAA